MSDAAGNILSHVYFNENFTFLAHRLDAFLIAKIWSINNVTEKSREPLPKFGPNWAQKKH